VPIKACTSDGSPGYKWGDSGTCYTYTKGDDASIAAAKKKAVKQALAQNSGKMPEKAYADLETVDLKGVEIMAADVKVYGTGDADPNGETYSIEDLERIAEASNAAADLRSPLKIGHGKAQQLLVNSGLVEDEIPAGGWLKNFRVKGEKLLCDIERVPKKLADLAQSAFRTRSPEIGAYIDQTTGNVVPEVVRGLALLGVTPPAFQTLDDLVANYSAREDAAGLTAALLDLDEELDDPEIDKVATFAAPVIWDPEKGASDVMEDLRRALNPPPDDSGLQPCRYWVRDVQFSDGGGAALVEDSQLGDSSTCWVVRWDYNSDGDPVPTDQTTWTLAQQAWVAASQSESAEAVAAPITATASGGTTSSGTADYSNRQRAAREFLDAQKRGDTTPMPETTKPEAEATTEEMFSEDERTGLKRLLSLLGLVKKDGEEGETTETPKLEPEAVKAFAAALGFPEETDVEALVAKVKAERETKPEIPEGMVLFAKADQEALTEMAQRGAEAKRELDEERKTNFLKTYARQGRINPADFDKFGKLYETLGADATKEIIEKLPINETLVLTYGASERDELMERLYAGRDNAEGEAQYAAFCQASGIPYIGPSGQQQQESA